MSILSYLVIYDFSNKIRLGENGDGGYVIGDLNGNYDCYISAGVSDEESFSRDFINKYDMNETNSVAFDGTIQNYPYHYTNKITFIKKNISPIRNNHFANLSYFIEKYDNIFLKMDIEGSEYPWLLSLSKNNLQKFKQIAIEFHSINDNGCGFSYKDKLNCFKKISETHYLVHAHGNTNCGTFKNIPNVIECTYIRKDIFDGVPDLNKKSIPIDGLDFPNVPNTQNYNLNFPPFVHN
jgi:hypothetical protein